MLATWGALTHGSGGLGPGIVTSVTVLGDISIAITNPSSLSVPMQTNGSAIKITTSGSAAYTALDLTKITLTVTDLGHDTSGARASYTRTIGCQYHIFGPYNEATVYQPNLGEFYIRLNDFIFNQDATWKSTVTAINFANGWLTGQPAGLVSSATRSDSLPYFLFPTRLVSPPWGRAAAGGTYPVEVACTHTYPQNMSPLACVEAFVIDGNANTGAIARSSTFQRSLLTPANATTVGYPVPTYQLSPAMPTTGTPTYRAAVRFIFKPWIGPPTATSTVTVNGDSVTGTGDAFYPSLNLPYELPFCFDYDDSHVPVYGVIDYAGTGTITHNVNVATIDVSGLCLTQAGAIASGKTYADFSTFAIAVRRLNNSSTNLTILSNNGLSTLSYKRPTAHTTIYTANGSVSGGVAVLVPVGSSVPGADLGCYSWRFTASSQTNFPPGYVAFEIQSQSGLPTTDVRIRGRDSGGGATANKQHMSRVLWRGINFDSTGVSVASENICVDGVITNGAPTAQPTEIAAVYNIHVDCQFNGVDPSSVAAGASVQHFQKGWFWDYRCDHQNPSSGTAQGSASSVVCGNVENVGCNAFRKSGATVQQTTLGSALGLKCTRVSLGAQGVVSAAGVQPTFTNQLFHNVGITDDTASQANTLFELATKRPIIRAAGVVNLGVWFMGTTMGGPSVSISNDGVRLEIDSLIMWNIGQAAPNVSLGSGRTNWGYQEQAYIRINKRITGGYFANQCYNVKGDVFPAPETVATYGEGAWDVTNFYWKGSVVTNSGTNWQALQDVAANAAPGSGGALSDTAYWYNSGISTATAYGAKPLRQGNSDWRYHVGIKGCIAANTSSGVGDLPSATSWYGDAWGVSEKPESATSYPTSWYTSPVAGDFTPKAAGPMDSLVAAGFAPVPFDLIGTAFLNDGTDAAGPLQR